MRACAEGGDEEVEGLLQRVAEGVLPEDRREALVLLRDAITDDAKVSGNCARYTAKSWLDSRSVPSHHSSQSRL